MSGTCCSSRAERDAEDRAHIGNLRRAGHVPLDLGYAFARPKDEPLLWLPDTVAGAVSLALDDEGDESYLATLGPRVQVLRLE